MTGGVEIGATAVADATDPTPAKVGVRAPGRGTRRVIGPFTLRHILALLGTLVVLGAVLLVLTAPIASPRPTALPVPGSSFFVLGQQTTGLAIGQTAPELTGIVDGQPVGLNDLDGNPIRLADLRGRPVWLSFWASWCPPCQEETPVLRQVYETHKAEGLELVAVSVQETTPEDVRRYVQTYGLDYAIGFDATSAIFHTYQGWGLPTHLFLDRDGVIRDIHLGPLSTVEAERILAPLLAK